MRTEKDCKELFKPKDGIFLPDLGSAAPTSVVALGELMEDLSPRGISRKAAGHESLLPAKENAEEQTSSLTSQHPWVHGGLGIQVGEKQVKMGKTDLDS